MTTSTDSAGASSIFEQAAVEMTEFNEMVLDMAKQSARASLNAYEKALKGLLDIEQAVAENAPLDWVGTLANTHVKIVQDASKSYLRMAREVLK